MSTKNAAPALLALLLFCSLPATTALAAAPANGQVTNEGGVTESDGTTNRLVLDGDVRSEYAEPGLDLGSSLSAADDELRVDHERFVVDHEFGALSTAEREERLESGLERVDERITELEERERRAVERHVNGEISDAVLLQILVRNHNEARELSAVVEELADRANAVSGYSNREEVREKNHRLAQYRTPIRARIDSATRGDASTDAVVLVETEANGYRLATVVGSTYLSETHRFDNRNESKPDQFSGLMEASDYTEDVYPWAYETGSGSSFAALFSYEMYRVQISHGQGTLDAHIDGGTRSVTDEVQELTVSQIPSTPVDRTWSDGGLELALNETPANGPVEVTVTDSVTGSPVDATVAVNGTVVGETGDDGTRWIVPPTGEYELTAETNDGSVNATVAGG
ncbi:DUF7096 domain-containing protein [Salinilacihabitans rarus]|uniref:DUF7096 domain-containing protein n=1 Tax=Salinilacihabitans rarus TaxID=2961596 RepID=UPI0020C8CE25|nr:hypothetical protein [Salinilacihabitans rarus]